MRTEKRDNLREILKQILAGQISQEEAAKKIELVKPLISLAGPGYTIIPCMYPVFSSEREAEEWLYK